MLLILQLDNCSILELIFCLKTLLHTLSLGGSSFIEKEDKTWYFFWSSILMFIVFDYLKKYYNSQKILLEGKKIVWLIILLISHRFFMNLNDY